MDWQYVVLTSGRSDAEVAGFVTDLTREYMDEVAEGKLLVTVFIGATTMAENI